MGKPQYELVRGIVERSGLWQEGRNESHKFVLSSEVYRVSAEELSQLQTIGASLYEVMRGLNQIVCFAQDPTSARGGTWDVIRRVTRTGIPKYHRRVQGKFPHHYPILFKVDLLRSKGKFWIVELDGVNTHGFGYCVILNRIRDVLAPVVEPRLQGVAPTIIEYLKSSYPASPLFLFMSGNSQFYEPYYRILARELKRCGIAVKLVGEWMKGCDTAFRLDHRLVLQFPIFRRPSVLPEIFADRYERGDLAFLIPPKTFMGSKAVTALLKNSNANEELEDILRSMIKSEALDALRAFMPTTYLVYPEERGLRTEEVRGKALVSKRAISSGTKGTLFVSGDKIDLSILAREAPYQTILQQELEGDVFTFSYFDEQGRAQADRWFARFTAHYHLNRLVDMDVTARRHKLVHGAKDCLQFSVVLP